MSWLYLFVAIGFEVAGTLSMKFSEGLTKLVPTVLIFVFYAIAFTLVTMAIKKIEISVAYSIWAGVGTALIALIGIFYFGESSSPMKILAIIMIITGAVLLRYTHQ
jgi:small multidrug resistance pump